MREREREEHLLCLFYSPSRFAAGFELFTRKRLLLLVGAACGAAMALNCAWRSRWGRYMPLGAIAPLIVGGLLFSFDPALKPLRESTVLLWALIAIVALWAVLAMRKTHVEKP